MIFLKIEDLGDDDIALEAHLEVKTCDRFPSSDFSTETGHWFLPLGVLLVRCRRLQDILVLQGKYQSQQERRLKESF